MLAALQATGQITVPDRLPDGRRMPPLVTPADWGTLAMDSLQALPTAMGGRDTWWHRHALFLDGPVQVAMDPVLAISSEHRRTQLEGGDLRLDRGHRNIRGVRYAGLIDRRIRFGGTVLEMQRLLVAPETEYVLAAQEYPGMGTGKLRPAEGNLYSLDHSLAEVWFDLRPAPRVRTQIGLGRTGLGPGTRNLLWSGQRAPAPYLLVEVDLGHGWTWRWVQSRQRGRDRLAADGAREGRYHPLGLSLRSLTKTLENGDHSLNISLVTARWTDVLNRGSDRSGAADWGLALAPWTWPNMNDPGTTEAAWYLAGHWGIDLQWRRSRSTWYAQGRATPVGDSRTALWIQEGELERFQGMVGHIRHGARWTCWTEWAPFSATQPALLAPLLPVSPLGLKPWSPWRPTLIQGAEWRVGGFTMAAEAGWLPSTADHPESGVSRKFTVSIPTATSDAVTPAQRTERIRRRPNRWWPPLVPISPFFSVTQIPRSGILWWSAGITAPVIPSGKQY